MKNLLQRGDRGNEESPLQAHCWLVSSSLKEVIEREAYLEKHIPNKGVCIQALWYGASLWLERFFSLGLSEMHRVADYFGKGNEQWLKYIRVEQARSPLFQ